MTATMMNEELRDAKNELARVEDDCKKAFSALTETKNKWRELAKVDGVTAHLDENSAAFKAMDSAGLDYDKLKDRAETLKGVIGRLSTIAAYGEPAVSGGSPDADRKAELRDFIDRAGAIEAMLEGDGFKALQAELDRMGNSDGARLGSNVSLGQMLGSKDLKSLVRGNSATGAGAWILPDLKPEYLDINKRARSILNLVASSTTSSDTVEWVRQTSRLSSAAFTPEATSSSDGAKPEGASAWQVVSAKVVNVAEWVPLTRRAARDVGRVQSILEDDLIYDLFLKIENSMLTGDGTNDTFLGIENTSGIGTYTQGAANAGESALDALHRAITIARLQFEEPNGILANPTDQETTILAKDDNNRYLYGNPSTGDAATIWGKPFIPTVAMASGTSLVADFRRGAEISFHTQGLQSFVADQHADFFVRNILVLLAEIAAAFLVKRPKCFTQVTFS